MAPWLPVVFLAGLSGSGKSTIAEWVAEDLHFLHLDVDLWDRDGLAAHGLRAEWEAFWLRREPDALAAALRARARTAGRAGTILSFPSHAIFTRRTIDVARSVGISVIVLDGPASLCLDAFLVRERASGRGLGREHWWRYNADAQATYGGPEYADVRLDVFRPDRVRRERHEIVAMVSSRLAV